MRFVCRPCYFLGSVLHLYYYDVYSYTLLVQLRSIRYNVVNCIQLVKTSTLDVEGVVKTSQVIRESFRAEIFYHQLNISFLNVFNVN